MRKKMLAMIGLFGLIGVGIVLIFAQIIGNRSKDEEQLMPIEPRHETALAPGGEDSPSERIAYQVRTVYAGDEVLVEDIKLIIPGYFVIFVDDDGEIGEIVGNSYLLPPGEKEKLKIKLKRKLLEGEIIYIGLHSDDGDSVFEYPGPDFPYHTLNSVPLRKRAEVKI
jgi:hypothetical protein